MRSENEKSFSSQNASAALNSTAKTFSQPNASYSRPNKSIAKQRRNEKQQLYYHLEEVVDVQEILYSLSTQSIESEIRQDFLHGLRGAPRLSQGDIEILKTFHRLTTSEKRPKTIAEFNLNLTYEANLKASEHFKFLLEGERKPVSGTTITYYDGRAVISRIIHSGYFSQIRFNNAKLKLENSTNTVLLPTGKQPATNQTVAARTDYEEVENLMTTLKKQLEETNRIV